MSYRELPPESDLDPAEWQVRFALFDGPRSPSDAYIAIGKIARQHQLPETVAALYFAEDMETLANPDLQKSLRQMEAGELEEVVLPEA